jgi:hypothetical protein
MFMIVLPKSRIGVCLLLALFSAPLASCRPAEPAEERVEDLDEVLAAVPDSAMRARWREAEAAGRLPPLDSLRVPTNPIGTRRPATVDTMRQPPPNVQIPQGAVADVRAVVTPAIIDYEGPATIEEVGATSIILRLADTVAGAATQARMEIHYKLPAGARLVQLPASAAVSLSFHESVEDGSQRKIIAIAQERAPVLMRVSDGDRTSYARAFRAAGLSARQNAPGADSISTVTFTYAGRALTLRPGERQRTRDAGGEVEIFLESSYYTLPAGVMLAEGDPYHVRFMVYRVAQGSPQGQ